jgi:hypothetical protein
MQEAYQGRYKNEASAYQAYNQTVKEKPHRTGKKLAKLSYDAQPEVRSPKIREQIRTGQIKRRPRPGGHMRGLWKINVTFTYVDQDGSESEETRSFIGKSMQYRTLLDIPYIEDIILASVDENIQYWMENDSLQGNYTNKQVEVVPIYRYDSDNVIDIDEIDGLVVEEYTYE